MAEFVTGFVVADIVQVHRAYLAAIREWARVAGAPGIDPVTRQNARVVERRLLAAYRQTNQDLDALAVAGAADARRRMRERLDKTAKRRNTNVKPHLRAALHAQPLIVSRGVATGAVGVGHIGRLDKVINPIGNYGPYWRAQEEGYQGMVGRVIRGYFFGPGYTNPEVPRAQHAGGGGPHPIFVSGRAGAAAFGSLGFEGGPGNQGGRGGLGTIQHPIKARHFIRDGAALAYRDWLRGLQQVEAQALLRIRHASGIAPGRQRRRR